MEISFDANKRNRTLTERGLDFADAERVFAGITVEIEDTRRNYGEQRIICYGLLVGRMGTPAWRGSPRFQHEKSQCARKKPPRPVL